MYLLIVCLLPLEGTQHKGRDFGTFLHVFPASRISAAATNRYAVSLALLWSCLPHPATEVKSLCGWWLYHMEPTPLLPRACTQEPTCWPQPTSRVTIQPPCVCLLRLCAKWVWMNRQADWSIHCLWAFLVWRKFQGEMRRRGTQAGVFLYIYLLPLSGGWGNSTLNNVYFKQYLSDLWIMIIKVTLKLFAGITVLKNIGDFSD